MSNDTALSEDLPLAQVMTHDQVPGPVASSGSGANQGWLASDRPVLPAGRCADSFTLRLSAESRNKAALQQALSQSRDVAERAGKLRPSEVGRMVEFYRIERIENPQSDHPCASSDATQAPLDRLVPLSSNRGIGNGVVAITRVDVAVPVVRLGGWRVIGLLESSEHHDRSIVTHMSDFPEEQAYVNSRSDLGLACDHCNSTRARRTAYILANSAGQGALVGSGCLQEFTSVRPGALRALAAMISPLEPFRDPQGGWRKGGSAVPMLDLLARAAACIESYGFISAAHSRQRLLLSTLDRVLGEFTGAADARLSRIYNQRPDHWLGIAQKACDWFMNVDPSSRPEDKQAFVSDCQVLLRQPAVEISARSTGGLAVAALAHYLRYQSGAPEPALPGQWIGEVGDEMDIVCRVNYSYSSGGLRGFSRVLIMVDDHGRSIKLVTRREMPEVGQSSTEALRLRARVRSRGVYSGLRQTLIEAVQWYWPAGEEAAVQ